MSVKPVALDMPRFVRRTLWLGVIVAMVAAVLATGASSVSGKSRISTLAGHDRAGFSGDGHRATSAYLDTPIGVSVDKQGNVYVADWGNRRVRKLSTNGIITTFTGTGERGPSGDGGRAVDAKVGDLNGTAVDWRGIVYISDSWRVRMVDHAGIITTFAGTGNRDPLGDGGPATQAGLAASGIAVDNKGNVYISDDLNNRIRKVTAGTISTVAGGGIRGHRGDGGPATEAELRAPRGVAADRYGNVYIADESDKRIRRVDRRGIITTFAGGRVGLGRSLGDGGPATKAQLLDPTGVAVDFGGNVYIADVWRLRKVATNGTITTVAGPGVVQRLGDGGPARRAYLDGVRNVAVDKHGNVYVTQFDRVRKISTRLRLHPSRRRLPAGRHR